MMMTMDDESSVNYHTNQSHILACVLSVNEEIEKGTGLSIVVLVDALIEHAVAVRASDIHIDPSPTFLCVRYRIDGILQDAHVLPLHTHKEIISRLKVLSGLRTDEHQTAQDGRFKAVLTHGVSVDIRLSIIPIYSGENAVLRLFSGEAETYTLQKLGFTEQNIAKVVDAINKPYGMILATGPTGSGKTTTLYTLIQMLNAKDTSIVTIEDPIEYELTGVNQIQVNARTGLTFANGLRSILRQDPNTIMVGEIRDSETAGLAVNISLTGHLVFSTLHTNDAATTLPRLLDMKVEPYLIASTVNIAIGQRLLRRLCDVCKIEKLLTPSEILSLQSQTANMPLTTSTSVYAPLGCVRCNQTGYMGRVGVYEVLTMTRALRELVLAKSSVSTLKDCAIQEGMVPLIEDGFLKVKEGLTTIEEVLKIRYE
jgi:type IV pilus assembly protein PilB